ncbi:MAG: RnfABCDGE type electron transport complex subunit G [Alphaproteobacteria bacterium]|nr:RnfABCDGE type electron transport complex subunit G [Alphaproteobacteria bacterium]
MAKKESTFLSMTLTLFLVTFLASLALGVVYELTKGPKALAENTKKNFAIKKVVPAFDNEPNTEAYRIASADGADSLTCYPARKEGKLVGTAIESFTMKGFSGLIRVMVGVTPEGVIFNTSVLEQKETPGLGTKMTEPFFKDQFNGKNPMDKKLMVKKDGGDVDAITASTITSRAYCDALQRAAEAYMKGGRHE